MKVDAATSEKTPAFDHAAMAASLSSAIGRTVTALSLPFNALVYSADERTFDVTVDTMRLTCVVADARCTRTQGGGGRGGRGGGGGGGARFGGGLYGDAPQPNTAPRVSPDGKLEASIRNYNVFTRVVGSRDWTALSSDGSDANAYSIQSLVVVARLEEAGRVSRASRASDAKCTT